MKLLFRTDVSQVIGTGHIARCLALAKHALKRGWSVCFVCRDPDSYIKNFIFSEGYTLKQLETPFFNKLKIQNKLAHEDWLPVSQEIDAMETLKVLYEFEPDWVIVDHYSLDKEWHDILKKNFANILVIDDLGDRKLNCDILLDQNLGASARKYEGKLPVNCRLLLGPTFALLRSEFREWRERSLEGRLDRNIENILITMGGVDAENYTLWALKEITKSKYAKKCTFTVVIGGSYPHTNSLEEFVAASHLKVLVLSRVKNMSEVMSKADLCIGAAGSTSWERCCLGQPTITLSISNNQKEIAEQLSQRNVAIYSNIDNLLVDFERFFGVSGKELLRALSTNSRLICDGFGASRVIKELEKKIEN